MAIGTISDSELGSSVRTKLNSALGQIDGTSAFAERIALAAGFTGGVTTVASAGTAQTIELDGKIHALTLDNASACTITGDPVGTGYSSALVLLKQDATGGRAWAFVSGTIEMGIQDTVSGAGEYEAWVLWSHDGSTVFASPAGSQQ